MAVYTDVTAEDLGPFLAGYDIGELLAYKGLPRASRIRTSWSIRAAAISFHAVRKACRARDRRSSSG